MAKQTRSRASSNPPSPTAAAATPKRTKTSAAATAAPTPPASPPPTAREIPAEKPAAQASLRQPPTPRQPPSHEQIAARAFELYLLRGGGDGQEMNDWLRAEGELRA